MSYALDDVNLLQLSLVCLHWSTIVCQEECWARKQVCIAGRPLCKNTILAWFPRWRLAHVVMTFSQKDALTKPISQAHAVRHHWGVYPVRPGCDAWHQVKLNGIPWLVCITAERGPTLARVMQYQILGGQVTKFHRPTTLGWTSATRPEEFAAMCSRISNGRSRITDVVVATTLCPTGYWSRLLLALQSARMRAPTPQPLCFDDGCPIIGTFALDRARRTIRVCAGRNGFCEVNFVGGPIDESAALTFFVAVPCGQEPAGAPPQPQAPRVHLLETLFGHPVGAESP